MLPNITRVRASAAGIPLSGAYFILHLVMRSKNPYNLIVGPSSPDGELQVTRDEILSQALSITNLYLMDFIALTPEWSGTIDIWAMSRSDIAGALMAEESFRSSGIFPEDYRNNLERYDAALSGLGSSALDIEVSPEGGGDITFRIVPQSAD
jgi:hypothetical protein